MKFNTTLMKRSVSAAAIVICAFVIFFELFESPVRVADFTPNQTPTQDQRLRPAADRMLFQEEDGSIEPTCIRGTIMIDDSTPMPRGTVCIYPNFIIEGMKPGSLLAKGTIQASGTYVVQNIPGARIPTDAEVQIVVTTKTDAQFEKTFRQVNKRISRKQSEFVEKNATIRASRESQLRNPEAKNETKSSMMHDKKREPITLKMQLLLERVDILYGTVASPKKITARINRGDNVLNIHLDTIHPPDIAMETPAEDAGS